MANSRKFVAETRDISLTVKTADSFNISYVNCEKGKFKLKDDQNAIRLIQTEKISPFYWLQWLSKDSPEVIVTLPENIDICENEAESNQVIITDIKTDKIYAEVQNDKVEARIVEANDIFLKCLNGSTVAKNVEVANVCTVETINGASVLEGSITKDAGLEVACENGITEISDKNKANLGYKSDECAHYVVHCLNGKAVVK